MTMSRVEELWAESKEKVVVELELWEVMVLLELVLKDGPQQECKVIREQGRG